MNTREATRNPEVDAYFSAAKKWREEMERLRTILLACPLTEELKWGKPCYTFQNANVVIMMPLKERCALLFAKGALLNDPQGILIQPTKNTQAARQMRFANVQEIAGLEPTLHAYLHAAIAVQKAGLDITYKQTSDFEIPAELQHKLEATPALKTAFAALTPGRQRGYLLHFSAPKQSRTRASRIEKWLPQILQGKGLHDQPVR